MFIFITAIMNIYYESNNFYKWFCHQENNSLQVSPETLNGEGQGIKGWGGSPGGGSLRLCCWECGPQTVANP